MDAAFFSINILILFEQISVNGVILIKSAVVHDVSMILKFLSKTLV
jgi:hypothetical protein